MLLFITVYVIICTESFDWEIFGMHKLRFVRLIAEYTNPATLLGRLLEREGVYPAGINFAGSLPRDMVDQMKMLPDEQRVIIVNQPTLRNKPVRRLSGAGSVFPFRTLYKNGGATHVIAIKEALTVGNYFLCFEAKCGIEERVSHDGPESIERFDTYEYRCHVDIEATRVWRNDPPYVNLDRDSDSIGNSSWDGNLVSWFESAFSTRMHFARQAGLLPEE